MEKDELLERWNVLINESIDLDRHNETAIRAMLQERVNILHRLNELSVYIIEGTPVPQALEETNALIRELDHTCHDTPVPIY